MARGQRDPALERQWRERVARWRASGLSVRAFCRQRGLTEPTFSYWKRERPTRDQASREVALIAPPKFIPLTVLPSATLAVEVRCPSGYVVLVSACDVSALAALFAALNPPISSIRVKCFCLKHRRPRTSRRSCPRLPNRTSSRRP